MKHFRCLLAVFMALCLLAGCGSNETAARTNDADETVILATTYPMYYLTSRLTGDIEGFSVEVMVSEAISCLHDYTLTTDQMKLVERADLIVMNGGGLEDFMSGALAGVSEDDLLVAGPDYDDPHYWLSPERYQAACETVAAELAERYPDQAAALEANRDSLCAELESLQTELEAELSTLSCRSLITFHDGFSWFADAFDLTIAAAIEEEEGAEASAAEIQVICQLIESEDIPAIFVERNGSTNAADIISGETGVSVYTLNTMIDGQTDYFTAMRDNVAAVKEALS